jgi:hypothetical protein
VVTFGAAMTVHELNFTNFHTFVQQNANIVVLASYSQAFNPLIAEHFRKRRPDVALCRLQLDIGATWFDTEARRALRRSHAWSDSAYYLICDRKFVASKAEMEETGIADAAIVGYALGAALGGGASQAQQMLQRHTATPVIAAFEAILAKRPAPRTPSAQPPKRDPYQVLGVSPGATEAEIDEARRQKILEYHPDLVMRAGPEMRALAATRTVEINVAWEQLRRRR